MEQTASENNVDGPKAPSSIRDDLDNDLHYEDFEAKVRQLEAEKRRMREEFDGQRAKMKELFLQKEEELNRKKAEYESLASEVRSVRAELDDAKCQLLVAGMQLESNVADEKRKAAEEIASLQQLVHETVEESSSSRCVYDLELRKLQALVRHLEEENTGLKNEKHQQYSPHHHPVQESSSLAPVLSAVTKKIVKKLGADAFTSQEEDHKEDPELMKSLMGPLEEEIKALKDKLRSTDEQLQKCRQCGHLGEQEMRSTSSPFIGDQSIAPPLQLTAATNTSFESKAPPPQSCDMCSNYEAQLVGEQKRTSDLEKSVERHKEELLKEIGFRKDMEEKWNEKKEEHKKQVAELTTRMQCCEQDLREMQDMFRQACDEMRRTLGTLTNDREKVQFELERLQKENDILIGKYSMHSQQLQNESINLPDTVEELQEQLLKSYQDLIIAKIAKETTEEEANTLRSDIMLLKDQSMSDQQNHQTLEENLVSEISQLKNEKHLLENQQKANLSELDESKRREREALEKLEEMRAELIDLRKRKAQLEEKTKELKTRAASLQQELDNSEAVQKDFVRLSQSLQMQLEKIRGADTQVRWQHDEDFDDCPSCRSAFSSSRRKDHCKHCGQIFCSACLSHAVPSGPNQRLSKVCDVCHTLLVKSSAPYFSTEAPHSPD